METATTENGLEKGDVCNRGGCLGIIDEHQKDDCSCHISPPCSACVAGRTFCEECGWSSREGED